MQCAVCSVVVTDSANPASRLHTIYNDIPPPPHVWFSLFQGYKRGWVVRCKSRPQDTAAIHEATTQLP